MPILQQLNFLIIQQYPKNGRFFAFQDTLLILHSNNFILNNKKVPSSFLFISPLLNFLVNSLNRLP